MITKKDIEIERTPSELRKFVSSVESRIKNCTQERHKAIQKNGIYKVFCDEIIPLSLFCMNVYTDNYKILPKLGNQGYDAIVKAENNKIYEKLEITAPHDGRRDANNAKLTVERGFGEIYIGNSGDDLKDLFLTIIDTCKKKSKKDYSDCALVIVIDFLPPFEEESSKYSRLLKELEKKILKINFNVKKIYLLIIPLDKVKKIYG